MSDIKLKKISSAYYVCIYRILLVENSRNNVEGQTSMNSIMKEVMKKEIIKWLDI